MKRHLLITALALAALIALGTGPAGAGMNAKTKVTIKAESGGFFGFVKSPEIECANDRKVTLYKQRGSEQDPKQDKKINSDTSSPNGGKYMWSTGNTGSRKGSYYARAGKIAGCKGASSKTIKAQK